MSGDAGPESAGETWLAGGGGLPPHYYGVPNDWLSELGRLVVIGTRLEENVRDLHSLVPPEWRKPKGPPDPTLSARCTELKKWLNSRVAAEPSLAPLIEWVTLVPDAMGERNRYIHARYAYEYADEGRFVFARKNPREPMAKLTGPANFHHLHDLIMRLEQLDSLVGSMPVEVGRRS